MLARCHALALVVAAVTSACSCDVSHRVGREADGGEATDAGAVDAGVDGGVLERIAALCGDVSGLEAQSPWPMMGRCPTRVGLTPALGPRAAPTDVQRHAHGEPAHSSGAVVAADGSRYATTLNGGFVKLYALAADGSLRWAQEAGSGGAAVPTLAAGGDLLLCVAGCARVTSAGAVTSLDAGIVADELADEPWAFGSVAVAPTGTGLVTGNLGVLRTLPAAYTWSRTLGGPLQAPTLSADGTIVYVATTTQAAAYAVSDGQPLWTRPLAGLTELAWPVVADGRVYFVGNALYALDALTGALAWSFPLTGTQRPYFAAGPAVGPDGTIYVCGASGRLHAVRPDGSPAWDVPTPSGTRCLSPIVDREGVVYSIAEMDLFAVSPDGVELWRKDLTGGSSSYATAALAMDATGAILVPATYELVTCR